MNREGKYKVVLIEPSEIVASGISAIIGKNPEFTIVQTLADPSYYNSNDNADVIIVNPAVIDFNERFDMRSYFGGSEAAIVALTHSNYEESVLRQYDECIGIYDNAPRIVQKLKNAMEQNAQNPKNDLKNIIAKYLGEEFSSPQRYSVLADIYTIESDLRKHSLIENRLLIPLVEKLENSNE